MNNRVIVKTKLIHSFCYVHCKYYLYRANQFYLIIFQMPKKSLNLRKKK